MGTILPLSFHFPSFYFIVGLDYSAWGVTRTAFTSAFLNIPAVILFLLRIHSFSLYTSALLSFSVSSIFGHCVTLIVVLFYVSLWYI
jgi:hypothetical protein